MNINTLIKLLDTYARISAYVANDCGNLNHKYHFGSALQYIRSYLNMHNIKINGTALNIEMDCEENYSIIIDNLEKLVNESDDKYFASQLDNAKKEAVK